MPYGDVVSSSVLDYQALWADPQGSVEIYGQIYAGVRKDGAVLVVLIEHVPPDDWNETLYPRASIVEQSFLRFAGQVLDGDHEGGGQRGHALAAAGEAEAVGRGRRDRHRGADRRARARPRPRPGVGRASGGCRRPAPRRCRSGSPPRAPAGRSPRAWPCPRRPPTAGSDVPKFEPRSPSPAAESSASQSACAATSASEWPSSPCGSSGQASPARCRGDAVGEPVHVDAQPDPGQARWLALPGSLTGRIMPRPIRASA